MPDFIFFNANVITLNSATEKAGLVAVKDGRIQAVASNDAVRDLKQRRTRLVDCKGKTLIPGFCDAHFHFWASALQLITLDLSPQAGISSIPDMLEKIQTYAQKVAPGSWIRATGYNEFYLAEKRHPTSRELDRAAPNHPVKLTHRSHHAHVLNSLALKKTGIDRYTPEPPGGLMERYLDTGEPNGVLFEMSEFLSDRLPRISTSEFNRGFRLLNQKLLSLGITSIHEASFINGLPEWESLCAIKAKKKFLPRITMALGVNAFKKNNTYSCSLEKKTA